MVTRYALIDSGDAVDGAISKMARTTLTTRLVRHSTRAIENAPAHGKGVLLAHRTKR
jgi:hypothetical protein